MRVPHHRTRSILRSKYRSKILKGRVKCTFPAVTCISFGASFIKILQNSNSKRCLFWGTVIKYPREHKPYTTCYFSERSLQTARLLRCSGYICLRNYLWSELRNTCMSYLYTAVNFKYEFSTSWFSVFRRYTYRIFLGARCIRTGPRLT